MLLKTVYQEGSSADMDPVSICYQVTATSSSITATCLLGQISSTSINFIARTVGNWSLSFGVLGIALAFFASIFLYKAIVLGTKKAIK